MKVHPVFYISLLELYRLRPSEDPTQHDPPEVMGQEEEGWEVERILDERTRRQKKQFLVRWKGWTPADNI
jgi:Chromo (CHRromatin Organisation MOdifier) domain